MILFFLTTLDTLVNTGFKFTVLSSVVEVSELADKVQDHRPWNFTDIGQQNEGVNYAFRHMKNKYDWIGSC